jgi:enterochelin esterase-like enzyme
MPSERHRKRRLRRACLGGAAGALVLVGAAGSSTPPRLRGTVLERSLSSAALKGRLRFELYLPPGYTESTARYPVVYFLHGLPASPYAFRGVDAVTQALDRSR